MTNPPLPRAGARALAVLAALTASLLLGGCAGLVDKPVRPTLYDLGPVEAAASSGLAPAATSAPLALAEIDASGALEGNAVLYRLGYADAHQLRAYALARWSAAPPQLVRQRLREQLGRVRPVLNLGESAGLVRQGGSQPTVLRLELEEFAHVFEAPQRSHGALRLRATLLANTAGGERLLGQRSFHIERPAPTPDAAGGVRALAAATDAAAAEINRWLQQVR